MKKIILAALLALTLSGCANVQNAWNLFTGATVSPQAVYIARNSFDALEATATNYIVFCKVHPRTVGCSKDAIARLIPAVRSGRVARNNLTQYQKSHPDQLGPTGLYDALVDATNTLQAIATNYNITGVVK